MLSKQNKYFSIDECFFLISYALLIATAYVFQETFFKPHAIALFTTIIDFLLIGGCVNNKKENKEIIMTEVAILAVFSIVAFFSGKPMLITYALLLVLSSSTSFPRIIKTQIVVGSCTIIAVYILSKMGIFPVNHFYRGSGQEAHTFGFGYYHVVPYSVFFMMIEYLYLKQQNQKKASWFELLTMVVLNCCIFSLSTLRLTYFLTYFMLIMYVVLVKFDAVDIRSKWIRVASVMVFPFFMAATVWINIAYDQNNITMKKMNGVLSDRLHLGHLALERYPITGFGQIIKTNNSTGSDYFYIDSGYLFSLLGCGVIFTIMLITFYTLICYRAARKNDKMMFIWAISVSVFSISNNILIALYMNPILMGLFYLNSTQKREI